MAKDPHAGEGHGQAGLVGGLDDLVVADGAARLDHRRGPGGGGLEQAVGEGEEGLGRAGGPLGQRMGQALGLAGLAGADGGDAGAVAAGATAVIQPGGSIRDDEVIAAADEAGVAMAFTGVRVFRH